MRAILALLLACGFAPLHAASGAPFLWQVRAPDSAVTHYLMGSLHILPASAHPLPPALAQAYGQVQQLVLESDLDAFKGAEFQQEFVDAGQRAPHTSAALRALVQAPLTQLGLPQNLCDALQAWYCALLLELATYQHAGFEAEYGIDQHFFIRAQQDDKPMAWLESPREQMDFLTRMPPDVGEDLLASTLDEFDDVHAAAQAMLTMWREGDTAALTEQITQMQQRNPKAYTHLLGQRNTAWRAPLARWFGGTVPTLVIVGAAHLVGEGGVMTDLRAQGFDVTPVIP